MSPEVIALVALAIVVPLLAIVATLGAGYRRDRRQRGVDVKVGDWLRERGIRDRLFGRGHARLTHRAPDREEMR